MGKMGKEEIIKKVSAIIRHYLPPQDYKICLFGSWARSGALETSDIDIGILGKKKAPFELMVKIREEVENIPTLRSIDVVDLNLVDESFKRGVLSYARLL